MRRPDWQFEVLRELFYGSLQSFVLSISHVANWDASGGKSGASFYRTLDDRFVIKHISSTELQVRTVRFLGVLPGYFKYMASIYFDGRASLLSKTVGLFQTTMTRKDSGQKLVHYICVMENAFYQKQLTRIYDLKGSSRNRFAKQRSSADNPQSGGRVLLDGNFLESTKGHPVGVFAEDHQFILSAVQNDTAFLYSINIVDYSMVVGLSFQRNDAGEEEETPSEMTVGIIDYLRQFDLIKRVESVGKSVGMIAGQSSPTIIEPGLESSANSFDMSWGGHNRQNAPASRELDGVASAFLAEVLLTNGHPAETVNDGEYQLLFTRSRRSWGVCYTFGDIVAVT
ncbi:hypothetical protein BBJ28_00005258 [Nothophytophthora sp. Chile5]|nr:hypothetical protein BBJ28_00005258 [Nothophytophthora sp. Chile5]